MNLGGWTHHLQTRWLLSCLLGILPALLLALALLLEILPRDWSAWLCFVLVAVLSPWLVLSVVRRLSRPLDTLANLVAALREQDYSMRAASVSGDDALSGLIREINGLADDLHAQRLSVQEGAALLEDVLAALDIAVIAFDAEQTIRLCNGAAARLAARPTSQLLGAHAGTVGLGALLEIHSGIAIHEFPGATGRWDIRCSQFRRDGRPLALRLISDLSRPLRELERDAWRRLIRVLAHEINNSLAPIQALSDTLQVMLLDHTSHSEWREDALQALQIIGDRATTLNRFLQRYSQLARLPPVIPAPFDVHALVRRLQALQRFKPVFEDKRSVWIMGDSDQVEQALINLLQNARDAGGAEGLVELRVSAGETQVVIEILDEGAGIKSQENLFVPFFTTKPGGSGIGLALSRQIAEGHGGSLALNNRSDARGAMARLILPRATESELMQFGLDY